MIGGPSEIIYGPYLLMTTLGEIFADFQMPFTNRLAYTMTSYGYVVIQKTYLFFLLLVRNEQQQIQIKRRQQHQGWIPNLFSAAAVARK